MNLKKYFLVLLSLLYFDLIFNLFTYDNYLRSSIINIFLFGVINSFIVFLITSIWNNKTNKIISYVIYSFLPIWYSIYYIFYKVFLTPFSIQLFGQSDQVLAFGKNVIVSIISNIHIILLFFIPLVIFIIFRKKIFDSKLKLKEGLIYLGCLVLSVMVYTTNIFLDNREIGGIYNLYFETNNNSLNIERLGVMASSVLDIERLIFDFEEKISDTVIVEEESTEELFEYDYNNLELDFNGDKTIDRYMNSELGTKKNKYTGMFEGMNLIYVVAESFSEIAVSEELTPTLYKMVHDGFYFENFYTSNNLSTIGGEFQALTGLYADNSILNRWRSGSSYFPYGLGNVFKDKGYKTYAYHNNSAYFQDRNVYLKSQGFNNFKACYNGLEKKINCNTWPQSDVEMIDKTVTDYINSDELFMTYYVTVSGHFYYKFSDNMMARKNKNYVKDLDCPEEVKGYIATQIELDKAMELLLKKLEEAGKLDNTVIVLLADHFPYNLDIDHINLLSDYKRDFMIEANSNNLIIYNSKMKSVPVSKVGMSIDVIPTVFNLFGIEYDSRLIIGKDILSSSPGLAIFKDKSWVSDKGTYYASSGKFVGEDVDDKYIKNINNIVNNRVSISRMIVEKDYYRKVLK